MAKVVKQAKSIRPKQGSSGVKRGGSGTSNTKRVPADKPRPSASKPKPAATKTKPAAVKAKPNSKPAVSAKAKSTSPKPSAPKVVASKPVVSRAEATSAKVPAVVAKAPAVNGKAVALNGKPVAAATHAAKTAQDTNGAATKSGPVADKSNPAKPKAPAKGKPVKEPVKPVIAAKPGQILLTPLRPTGAVPPSTPKPATPAPPPEPAPKKIKPPLNPPPLPPAPVTTDSKAKKNQAGLSSRELDVFRDLLLAKRREILGDMSSMEREALRGAGSNLSNLPVHMADMGTDNYEQEFTLGLVEKDRQMLREINLALAKIQNGTYGICEGTGKPISKARLEAQPWSKYSIEYVRTLESRKMFRR